MDFIAWILQLLMILVGTTTGIWIMDLFFGSRNYLIRERDRFVLFLIWLLIIFTSIIGTIYDCLVEGVCPQLQKID